MIGDVAASPGTRPARPSRLLRATSAVRTLVAWTAIGAALTLTVVAVGSVAVGHRPFNVLSGSMEPALGVGSVVVTVPVKPLDLRPGDIVTFPDPGQPSRLITHRLRAMTVRDGRADMVTKGDANDAPERWNVAIGDDLGRVAFHVPKLGYARVWMAGRGGRLLAVGLILLWGVVALRQIWRSDDTGAQVPAPRAKRRLQRSGAASVLHAPARGR